MSLQRLARRADKISQHGHVGTVGANASRIDRQAEAFGKIEIDSGVIKFGETEARSWCYAIQSRRVHRPRRPMTLPGTPRQFIKLLPIAFLPSVHRSCYFPVLRYWMPL